MRASICLTLSSFTVVAGLPLQDLLLGFFSHLSLKLPLILLANQSPYCSYIKHNLFTNIHFLLHMITPCCILRSNYFKRIKNRKKNVTPQIFLLDLLAYSYNLKKIKILTNIFKIKLEYVLLHIPKFIVLSILS